MPICSRCGVDQPDDAFSEESQPLCECCYEMELEEEAAGGAIGAGGGGGGAGAGGGREEEEDGILRLLGADAGRLDQEVHDDEDVDEDSKEDNDRDNHNHNGNHNEEQWRDKSATKKPHKIVPLSGAARILNPLGELMTTNRMEQNDHDGDEGQQMSSEAAAAASAAVDRPPDISLLKALVEAVDARGYSPGFGLDSREVLEWRLKRVLFDQEEEEEQTSVITWFTRPLVQALLDNSQTNLTAKIAPMNIASASVMEPQSLLHWLCQWKLLQIQCGWKGHDDMVDLLLRAGAPVDACLRNKCTPLFFAVKYATVDTCRLLLQAGANPLHKDCRKQTCLRNALPQANPYVLKLLLQSGVQADETFVTETYDGGKVRINALDILVTEFVSPSPDVSWATLGMASVDDYAMCILILLQAGIQISPHYPEVTYFLSEYLQGSILSAKRAYYTSKIAALFMGQWLPAAAKDEIALVTSVAGGKSETNISEKTQVGSSNDSTGCSLCLKKSHDSRSTSQADNIKSQQQSQSQSTNVTLYCGHAFCSDCILQYASSLGSPPSASRGCPTCHRQLGQDLLQQAATTATTTVASASKNEGNTDGDGDAVTKLSFHERRLIELSRLALEQLQFECDARNLVVAQKDNKDHCIDSLVHDWQDFTLAQGLGKSDNRKEVDEGNASSRLVAELTLSNTMISEDNHLWVAPSSGSVMIQIVVKGIPIFALVSTTSPYTVVSPGFVQTFGFQLNLNLQVTMSDPMKFVRAEDDDQKMAKDVPMNNDPDEALPPPKPRVITAPEVTLAAVQDFSFSLGKSGIRVHLPSALQAYEPHTRNWPVGVVLGLDMLQSAAWTQLNVEVDLEVCLGRTVGLLTGHTAGLDFDLLEPRRADHVEQDFRYYSHDGKIFWTPLWQVYLTKEDCCLSMGQFMPERLPYPQKRVLGNDADNTSGGVTTKCAWCCREFPFLNPNKKRDTMDWLLSKPKNAGMIRCTLCGDEDPTYYCDNNCRERAKPTHSAQSHAGVELSSYMDRDAKWLTGKSTVLLASMLVGVAGILAQLFARESSGARVDNQ